MKIVSNIEEIISIRNNTHGSVGFVPTMGALHNGHLSLIRQARMQNDLVVVSIFINPTQFLANEDFDNYPKKEDADLKICVLAGVDVVFMPKAEDLYFKCEPKMLAPRDLAYVLEGEKRPGHFDGVLNVLIKFFNIIKPTNVYFGKKDVQQFYIVKNMIKTLFLPINIVACDIVREGDGLALSSRNSYLGEEEKIKALGVSLALKNASQTIMKGEREASKIENIMLNTLSELEVDYVKVLDRDFKVVEYITLKNTLLLVAVKIGKTRLIDNLWI